MSQVPARAQWYAVRIGVDVEITAADDAFGAYSAIAGSIADTDGSVDGDGADASVDGDGAVDGDADVSSGQLTSKRALDSPQ